MKLQQTITEKLAAALVPDHLEVVNESHQHNVPANSETHFKLVIVSPRFEGKRQVGRHQSVYALLKAELEGPVHALALHTYTAAEWRQRHGEAPLSPPCLGGSKAESEDR
jgi:BolA protein